jgi:hypothetical protein
LRWFVAFDPADERKIVIALGPGGIAGAAISCGSPKHKIGEESAGIMNRLAAEKRQSTRFRSGLDRPDNIHYRKLSGLRF